MAATLGSTSTLARHHVRPPARRHRLHPRTRPRRAQRLGGADLLPGPACAGAAPARRMVLDAWPALARALHLAPGALPHRHRDPSRRDDRPARLHRPRHGRRRRRDGRDRRRVHDLPGRDARRHVADQGRQAPPDARPRRDRRRQLAGAGRLHGRRRRARRLERGGRQAGAAGRHRGRQPGARDPCREPMRRARPRRRRWASRPTA